MLNPLFSPDSQILSNVAAALSLSGITLGINIIFFNGSFVNHALRTAPPSNPKDHEIYNAMCQYIAVREFVIAGANIFAWLSGQPKAQGVTVLLWAGLAIGDGFVQYKLNGTNPLLARPLWPLLAGIGSVLMGWFE
ncbi:hypothetical protein N7493_006575 [Penicillium malachiteum]|uniref:Uncharacterized protein n=1 Tax=Penicillium malachiteum TaxID=1324776 RepID=A0AAD6MVN2_9EURO|nr:hypothetical protein N7493_006575 [Penicillium malachiteum]